MKNTDGVMWQILYGFSLHQMDMYVTLAVKKDKKKKEAWLITLQSSKYHSSIHLSSWHKSIPYMQTWVFSHIE